MYHSGVIFMVGKLSVCEKVLYGNSVLCAQFCNGSKTDLKIKVYFLKSIVLPFPKYHIVGIIL